MKNTLLLLLVSSLLFGCQKYIDFDAETVKSKLVINGFLHTDQFPVVHVSRSLSVIDNANLNNVNNAVVNLLDENGNLIEVLTAVNNADSTYDVNGFYQGTSVITNSEKYQLEVSAAGYDKVNSTTYIPLYSLEQTSPLDSNTVQDINYGGNRTDFTFHFADNGAEDNYYGIKFYGLNAQGFYDELYGESTDVSVDVEFGSEILFTDKYFNGSTHDFHVKLVTDYYTYNDTIFTGSSQKYDSIMFVVNSYSRDLYLYQKSFQSYQNYDEFFSQPVQVYSNVENGLGVFGGIKEDSFTIEIK